jgi:hypothetical protein
LDELLVFNKLPPSMIRSIVDLRLQEIQARLNPRRVELQVTDAARDWLANRGYSEEYGARAVARVVRDKVANPVASALLDGHIRDGDTITIDRHGDSIVLQGAVDDLEVLEPESQAYAEADEPADEPDEFAPRAAAGGRRNFSTFARQSRAYSTSVHAMPPSSPPEHDTPRSPSSPPLVASDDTQVSIGWSDGRWSK